MLTVMAVLISGGGNACIDCDDGDAGEPDSVTVKLMMISGYADGGGNADPRVCRQ